MSLVVTFDGVNVTTAESITGWSSTGISNPTLWTDEIYKQGSSCVGFSASNKSGYAVYTSPNVFNFNTTYAGQHIFVWLNVSMPGTLKDLSQGGLYLIAGSSTSDYKKFLVASSDYPDILNYGFVRFMFDPTKTPTQVVGNPDMSSIRVFGVWIDSIKTVHVDQLFIDRIDVGRGLRVRGTSSNFWEDLFQADKGTNNDNVYGIVQKLNGNYAILGSLKIGDDINFNATDVSDSSKIVTFLNQPYYLNGSWVSLANDNSFNIAFVDNALNPTKFKDGEILGEDAGRFGSYIRGSSVCNTQFSAANLANPNSFVKLFSTTLSRIRGGIEFQNSPNSLFYSGLVSKSGTLSPNSCKVRNLDVMESSSADSVLIWNDSLDIANTRFSFNSSEVAVKFIQNTRTYDFFGIMFVGNTADIKNSTNQTLYINKKQGSNPSVKIGDVIFLSTVTLTILGSVSLYGAEIRIYDLDSPDNNNFGTELAGVEFNTLSYFAFTSALGNEVWIQIILPGYEEYGQRISIPDNDAVLNAQLNRDNNL
jgi:hypothetical protein